MRVALLVWVLLIASVPIHAEATSGRAMTAEIVIGEYVWTSSDVIEIEVYVSGAPFNRNITLDWELRDENGILDNDTIIFQMAGSTNIVQFNLSRFYSGGTYHDLSVEVKLDSTVVTDNFPFTVLRNSLLQPASNLVIFGDSLSDMGNGNDSAIVSVVFSSPPYWNGRFSNGPVWIEHISNSYGLSTTFGNGLSAGDNRAFGGSQTGQGYAYLTLPNVGTQINNYLTNVQSNFTNSDIVFLWAGGNDFLYGTGNPDLISQNMASHLRTLAYAGASRFVVANLPPLELTPEGASRSSQQQATMASDVISYNNKLALEINNLSSSFNIDITLIDAWSIFNQILNNANHVGISNTQDQACTGGATVPLVPLPICGAGANVVSNVDEYLFFDRAHPSATMHKIIGQFAITNIGEGDTDGDGIIDTLDICAWTVDVSTVNSEGCDWSQQDEDYDGVVNSLDNCQDTLSGFEVDENGCADYQKDTDGDGLTDDLDPCPYGMPGDDYDSDGCIDLVDDDDDNDAVLDSEDACSKGMIGLHTHDFDSDGCHDDEDSDDDDDGLSDDEESAAGSDPFNKDSDNDGVWDGEDEFPVDPTEWKDSDKDGYGDNSDAFPYDDSEWVDSDYDDFGDNIDRFPLDPTEWADADEDGTGDNSDSCPYIYGESLFPKGCPDRDYDGYSDDVDEFPDDSNDWNDSDKDGYGDNIDVFPNNPDEWLDSDFDGFGDNSDFFPYDQTEWYDTDFDGCGDNIDKFPLDSSECSDSDLDGVGDNSDPWPLDPKEWKDSDYDGVGDNSDFDPFDASETKDSDGDGVGDNADPWPFDSSKKMDSDGDGVADSRDAFPNNANLDSWIGIIIGLLIITIIGAVGVVYFSRSKRSDRREVDSFEERPVTAPDDTDWN